MHCSLMLGRLPDDVQEAPAAVVVEVHRKAVPGAWGRDLLLGGTENTKLCDLASVVTGWHEVTE